MSLEIKILTDYISLVLSWIIHIYIPQTRNCHCVGLLYNLSYMYARLTNKKNTNLSVWSPKRNEAFPFHCIKKFA